VAKVGTSKAGATISQQAAVHPWLAADAHANKQRNRPLKLERNLKTLAQEPLSKIMMSTPTAAVS
jgi:hypothetical protein